MTKELATSALLWVAAATGTMSVPEAVPEWTVAQTWDVTIEHPVFEAQSTELLSACAAHPEKFVQMPLLLYGAHELFVDGKLIRHFGDKTFENANYVINFPYLRCSELPAGVTLSWRAHGYSPSFGRVLSWPRLQNTEPWSSFFSRDLYIAGSIALILLSIFSFFVMYRREVNQFTFPVCISAICISIYQIGTVAPAAHIALSSVRVNQISDFCINLGFLLLMHAFWVEGLISARLYKTHRAISVAGMFFHLTAYTGDMVQIGTSMYFPTALACLISIPFSLIRSQHTQRNLATYLKIICSISFFVALTSEMILFSGSAESPSFLSIGIIFGYLSLILAVNRRITQTYKERDELRENLEAQVELKTSELRYKTAELQLAMNDLRHTQAELIHSAKLASLGTLSAGIAHEINNSVNFVSGAITPLERLIGKLEAVSARDYEVGRKLLASIRDGISITVEIVKSLRQFTGLNPLPSGLNS